VFAAATPFKMRRCTLFFRLRPRPIRDDEGFDEDNHANEINEKRVRRPRDWSAIVLTAIRLLQFAYFAFAYFSLHGFQRSSYFREDGPWQHSPDEMRHSLRMMRWVRMQVRPSTVYDKAAHV
jgi:hypothetical protein